MHLRTIQKNLARRPLVEMNCQIRYRKTLGYTDLDAKGRRRKPLSRIYGLITPHRKLISMPFCALFEGHLVEKKRAPLEKRVLSPTSPRKDFMEEFCCCPAVFCLEAVLRQKRVYVLAVGHWTKQDMADA